MKFTKVIAGAAIATIAVSLLAGCGSKSSNSSSSKSVKEITVWAWDDTYNIPAVKEAAKLWSNKNVKVKVVSMSQDQVVQKLNTSLPSGNKTGLPNIVLVEDYRIQGYLKSYPSAFSSLNDVVKKNNFASYKFAVNTVKNNIYGVPFDSGVTGLFYRTDLLKQAGYTSEQMSSLNWDQFVQVARDVKAKTGKALMSLDPSDLGLIRMIMQESGTWYTDSDGKVTIDDNKALKYGLELEAKLYKEGLVEKVSGWTAGQEAVQTGKVASSVNGSWYSSTITAAKDQSGKWKIAPIPALPTSLGGESGKTYASNSGGAGWYVLSGIDGEDEAKDFLKETFASNTDLMGNLATQIGLVSTMKAASDTAVYNKPNEFYSNQKTLKDFSEWSQIVTPVNYGDQTYAIESTMTGALQEIVNGKSVDSVLKDYQKQVEAQVATAK
ncbi:MULTISPECIES: ABC transporter substrate-binding protein [unclassified Lactococcus]|uniref:ABC transporter substrate-binding protein n=1 Tax=unclassified Lactococcus TaxID=2643510 RepID=UPI0011CA35D0|nr:MULTISPECIES: extracellular solute-binding protein [unclassified Lactococcus]MQW22530.1 extracellular solute-binding protein [Lactococcus sp. dk101]TXK45554.1 extracellular solute-binding protein [Lactococcus sp. dk310]TXK51404.1 extracellular solute-binding protein [Lactococcus sp. dk322]